MIDQAAPIATIARDLRAGRSSALALIEQVNAAHAIAAGLNAYRSRDDDAARVRAQAVDALLATGIDTGPLMGIPVSVKDLYGVPGLPVYGGTNTAFPDDFTAAGPVVARLLRQLGIVTGKTHTVEFAFGGLGINAHWGTPVNPWSGADGPRVPGGSSSGAAVSLAEGSALLALGTDTAGSVRVPAAFCGQAGLKPTVGRWETAGIVPLSSSLDTPGLLARSVADLAYGFAALDPQHSAPVAARSLAGLRVGVPQNFFFEGEDAVLSVVDQTLRKLESAGAVLVPLELPGCDTVFDIFRHGGLAAPELSAWIARHCPERIARLDPVVRMRVEGAQQISAHEYIRRREELALRGTAAQVVFEQCDVLATPTVAIAPPRLADVTETAAYAAANMAALRNTVIANLFGWCAMTLPVGLDSAGLPVGLQLMAPPMADPALLAAGLAIENGLGPMPGPVRRNNN